MEIIQEAFMKKTFSILMILCMIPLISTAGSKRSDDWQFKITPSIWTVAVDGEVSVLGETASLDVPFSDILDLVDIGGEVSFEARTGRMGILASASLLSLTYDVDVSYVSGNLGLDITRLELGLAYDLVRTGRIYESGPGFALGVMGGARYSYAQGSVGVIVPVVLIELEYEDDTNWLDLFAGARVSASPVKGFKLYGEMDIAGFDSDENLSLNLDVRAVAALSDMFELWAGYRLMQVIYAESSGADLFRLDITFSGMAAGFTVTLR